MPIDRAATLRNAELLLRQGKLDAAIAAYSTLVEDQPADWSTANTLGDLYIRVGQPARAAQQFTRTADQLSHQGFVAKAAALYKKALKLNPDDEHALMQSADIAASQGLLVDARVHLGIVADRRAARGDARGAAEIRIRIDTLDPSDYSRRVAAAGARADLGDVDAAVRDLKCIARELVEKDRTAEAVEALRCANIIAPADTEVRSTLRVSSVDSGDFFRAREFATTVEELEHLANLLENRGRPDEALGSLRDAARLAPHDDALVLRVARGLLASGDAGAAEEFLTDEAVRTDSELLLMAADCALRAQRVDQGLGYARRFLDDDPQGREQIALLSCNLAERDPAAASRVLELAVAGANDRRDWSWSVVALQEFVRRVPTYVPALLRLVEVCIDGGLEATMYEAQAQLADAYISNGCGAEARAIAEDLVDRGPQDEVNIERLRRALELLNEPNAEAIIAERVRHPVRFESTAKPAPPRRQPPVPRSSPAPGRQTPSHESIGRAPIDPIFALGPSAIDIDGILGDFDVQPVVDEPRYASRADSVANRSTHRIEDAEVVL